jgi:hypothetical protein
LAAQLDRNPIRVKPAEVHTSGAREAVERDYAKLRRQQTGRANVPVAVEIRRQASIASAR